MLQQGFKIGIDEWRKEWVGYNNQLIFPHVKEEIQSMVESFYKYLENKNKMENQLLEAYQQRVVDELIELNRRAINLTIFRNSDSFNQVDSEEQKRLIKQLDIMQSYREILNERINNFK